MRHTGEAQKLVGAWEWGRTDTKRGCSGPFFVWLAPEWLKVWLGRGDGTFAPYSRPNYPWNGVLVDPGEIELGDLDRDGILDLVRTTAGHVTWFAGLPESEARGYKPGRFSFNVEGGRCEACEGNGSNRLEMDFLADVWVTCPVCEGHRFNRLVSLNARDGLPDPSFGRGGIVDLRDGLELDPALLQGPLQRHHPEAPVVLQPRQQPQGLQAPGRSGGRYRRPVLYCDQTNKVR